VSIGADGFGEQLAGDSAAMSFQFGFRMVSQVGGKVEWGGLLGEMDGFGVVYEGREGGGGRW
jgi:hypothetical protein